VGVGAYVAVTVGLIVGTIATGVLVLVTKTGVSVSMAGVVAVTMLVCLAFVRLVAWQDVNMKQIPMVANRYETGFILEWKTIKATGGVIKPLPCNYTL
jgi:hypothetical protein